MKRSGPLKRKTGLKPGKKRLKRSRLKSVGRKRQELAKRQFGPQAESCRGSRCTACGVAAPCDPHHVIPRSRGGLDSHTAPLCRFHHTELHAMGTATFERKYGVNLVAVAAEMQQRVKQQTGET